MGTGFGARSTAHSLGVFPSHGADEESFRKSSFSEFPSRHNALGEEKLF